MKVALNVRGQTLPDSILTCSMLCPSSVRHDYPLNLSISVSGGKETNKDSLSNGE